METDKLRSIARDLISRVESLKPITEYSLITIYQDYLDRKSLSLEENICLVKLYREEKLNKKYTRTDIEYLLMINGGAEGLNLSNCDLRDINLESIDLTGINLIRANLSNVRFGNTRTIEYSQNISKKTSKARKPANLTRAKLNKANLSRAKMGGVMLKEASLRGANFSNASLWYVKAEKADFRKANMKYSDLLNAELENAKFLGANLSNANLLWAVLSDSKIRLKDFDFPIIQENKENLIKYYRFGTDVNLKVKLFEAQKQIDKRIGEARDIYIEIKTALESSGRYGEASKSYYREKEMERKTYELRNGNMLFFHGIKKYRVNKKSINSLKNELDSPQLIYISKEDKDYKQNVNEYKEILSIVEVIINDLSMRWELNKDRSKENFWKTLKEQFGKKVQEDPKILDPTRYIQLFKWYQYIIIRHFLYYPLKENLVPVLKYAVFKWLFSTISKWTCGYGERPFRTIIPISGVIFTFAGIFCVPGLITKYGQPIQSFLDSLIYSIASFTTMTLSQYEAVNNWAQILTSLEAALGISIFALLMFSLGNRIKKN